MSSISLQPGDSVAFIGIGVMGRSMAGHLIKAGFKVRIHTRTASKAADLLAQGAIWCESATEAVRGVKAVITMLGYPDEVRAVLLGQAGLIATCAAPCLIIDMSTSEPSLAIEIAADAKARGLSALDAPVSGGDLGARNAALSIMVGGEAEAFDAARPLFAAMGKTIVHQGPAGAGQHTKMSNQIAIAGNMLGVMEALLYARRCGLDPEQVLASIGSGAAGSWSLSNLYPRVLRNDFAPGFYIKHFVKDMGIALSEAESRNLRLPGLELAHSLYSDYMKAGGGDEGTQALYKALDRINQQRVTI
ncbi:MAG: hypothetical protein RL095_3549 [Verrucomicrobiota bacterium]|jgi:3-hydroxyisobutyrate dehydrogenase